MLNAALDAEADELVNAERYERTENRKAYRSGHYARTFTTRVGDVELHMPKLRGLTFSTAIIERYRRRESSIEEALMEMYLAGVSTRRIEDISEALWETSVSPSTMSNLNKQVYEKVDAWRNRPLEKAYPYVFVDGIFLKRCWGGSYENLSVLIAIGVDEDGYREVIGCTEGFKEDMQSWKDLLTSLVDRGLAGVKLVVGDKCNGLVGALSQVLPKARYQRCMVHWYRNVMGKVSQKHRGKVVRMLKAIHEQEDKSAAIDKALEVVADLEREKFTAAAKCVKDGYLETLTYMDDGFPSQHWRRIRTNNMIERLNREIRRRSRVVGTFSDGRSALMLVAARCKYVQDGWNTYRYLDMSHPASSKE